MKVCDFCFKKRFITIKVHFDIVCRKCFNKNQELKNKANLQIYLGSGEPVWETNEIDTKLVEKVFNTNIKDNKLYFRAIDGNFSFIDINDKIIIFKKEEIYEYEKNRRK